MLEEDFLEWSKRFKEGNAVKRYVYRVYFPGSPYVRRFPELTVRKQVISSELGLHEVPEMSDELAELITEFSRACFPREWSIILSNEETFYEYHKLLITPIGPGRKDVLKDAQLKAKLMSEMEIIDMRLNRYYRQVFGEDKIEVLKRARVTPEQVAKEGVQEIEVREEAAPEEPVTEGAVVEVEVVSESVEIEEL